MVGVIAGELPDWISCGDGYGYGYSDGYGYGYGDGDGYGYGYSDGYGYGYGDGKYWRAAIATYALLWTAEARTRLSTAMKAGATIAYWRSDKNGRACNGGKNNPVAPGVIETAPGPLFLCKRGTLHATRTPPKWKGARVWIVAMHGEIVEDGEKIGALKRGIIGECLSP